MSEPFIGEIQLFGFDFAPRSWAFCNGTLMLVRQNPNLFALLGTTYGGDGRTNYRLPNFTGRAACSQGPGGGLTPRNIGDDFGAFNVALSMNETPAHSHPFGIYVQPDPAKRAAAPSLGNALVLPGDNKDVMARNAAPDAQFAPSMIGPAGNGQNHENRQPFLALNFSIALEGVFPSFQ